MSLNDPDKALRVDNPVRGGDHGGTIRLVELEKSFGEFQAVAGIDLDIPGGEFFSLLGPSGCGKTTTLRMIAGFEEPTKGKILLDGVDVAHTAPHKRPVNTVFQNYALFPFMTVWDNVAFGLRYTDASKQDARTRVGEALELVEMGQRAKQKPVTLSGGQQQRVALARALVLGPKVLLLDEPLGALDAKLRKALQIQLKALQERVGITFVYVTHDQEEALTMSDRLAVMAQGLIEQVGSPTEVYTEPTSAYVADFLGVSNLLDVDVMEADGPDAVAVRFGEITLRCSAPNGHEKGPAKAVLRPERIGLLPSGDTGPNRVPGMVERCVFLGSTTQVYVRLAPGASVQALVPNSEGIVAWEQGSPVSVHLPADALRLLPA
jgi:spermidine/putrescine transport system ATP-binding protein